MKLVGGTEKQDAPCSSKGVYLHPSQQWKHHHWQQWELLLRRGHTFLTFLIKTKNFKKVGEQAQSEMVTDQNKSNCHQNNNIPHTHVTHTGFLITSFKILKFRRAQLLIYYKNWPSGHMGAVHPDRTHSTEQKITWIYFPKTRRYYFHLA